MCIRDRTYSLAAGDLFGSFPGQFHSKRDDPSHPWRLIWFTMEGAHVASALEYLGLSPQNPILRGRNFMQAIKTLLPEICAAYQRPAIPPTFAINAAWR